MKKISYKITLLSVIISVVSISVIAIFSLNASRKQIYSETLQKLESLPLNYAFDLETQIGKSNDRA